MLTCPFTANPVKSKLMSSCLLHRSVFPSINSSTSLGAKCKYKAFIRNTQYGTIDYVLE